MSCYYFTFKSISITRSAHHAEIVIKRSSVRPFVHLSVCPIDRQQQRQAAGGFGFAAEAGHGQRRSRYRSTAAAAVRHADRENFGQSVRRSNALVGFVWRKVQERRTSHE